ncbi:hypothetical protein [Rhizosaccharibacter radicis]|uniref:Uncharacterized protein n=1 Tax=Rhizosaccharibacter radicis TaxID=2782605 RepID=A0ABT1VWC2_9PROT|nr:hypothetical protein [Acetobacteraceae bacterium KSS12]
MSATTSTVSASGKMPVLRADALSRLANLVVMLAVAAGAVGIWLLAR